MTRPASLTVLLAMACSGPQSAPAPEAAPPAATGLRIALQANAHGDIEPCG